jgi:hypothetical protein
VAALLDVVHREWDPLALRASTARFSGETFDRAVLAWLDDVFTAVNDG